MDIKHLHDLHERLVDLQQQVRDTHNELAKALREQLPDGTRINVDPPVDGDTIVTSSGVVYEGCLWVWTKSIAPHLIDPTRIVP